jgi:hypothetical protein
MTSRAQSALTNTFKRVHRTVFVLGALLFAFSSFWLVFSPTSQRAVPFEADDAYTLIQQSPQMETCFLQDCPALNDLRPQLQTPSSNAVVAAARAREYKSTFLIWHPLYSLILSGIHDLGLSWEASFNSVLFVGSILLSVGLAIFLRLIFGEGPAGVALMFLSIHVFQGPGFNIMLPKTMALVLAMLLWAGMIKWPLINPWVFPAIGLALVSLHPMGQIYLLLSIGVYVLLSFLRERKVSLASLPQLALAVVIAALPLILPHFVERPELSSLAAGQVAEQVGFAQGAGLNAATALTVLHDWAATFWPFSGGMLIVAPVFILAMSGWYGYAQLDARRRLLVLVWGAAFVAASIAGLGYFLSGFPAYLFENQWPLIAALIYGLLGSAGLTGLEGKADLIRDARKGNFSKLDKAAALRAGLIVFAAVASLAQFVAYHARNYSYTLEYRETKGQLLFSPGQPEMLLEMSRPGEDVLYTREILMHHFFTHGLLDRGAVYFPALREPGAADQYIAENPNLKYLVAWNPLETLQHDFWPWQDERSIVHQGALLIAPGKVVSVISQGEIDLSSLQLLVRSTDAVTLHVRTQEQIEFSLPVEANTAAWLEIPGSQSLLTSGFTMEVAGPSGLELAGLRLSEDQSLNWPWDQGISFEFDYELDDFGPISAAFVSRDLFPGEAASIEILDDNGSSVVARIHAAAQ